MGAYGTGSEASKTHFGGAVCDVILAASGTVTLEIVLHAVPMVIVYKIFPPFIRQHWIAKVPYIGLCNIIAGETVFGLPTGIPMIAIFIIGLILGILLWKMLKMAIILSILVGIGMYFGVVGSGFIGDVRDLLMNYGPQAIQLAALVIGILPFGLGIAAGFVIGLLKG